MKKGTENLILSSILALILLGAVIVFPEVNRRVKADAAAGWRAECVYGDLGFGPVCVGYQKVKR